MLTFCLVYFTFELHLSYNSNTHAQMYHIFDKVSSQYQIYLKKSKMNAGTNVKNLLESKKMRKKDLIDLLGISRQGFEHKLKTGFFKPDELEIVANYLQVSVNTILGDESSASNVVYKEKITEDSTVQKLMEKFFEELNLLRQQLQKKDEHIDKLLDMLGKLDPISEQARVLNLGGQYKEVA